MMPIAATALSVAAIVLAISAYIQMERMRTDMEKYILSEDRMTYEPLQQYVKPTASEHRRTVTILPRYPDFVIDAAYCLL